MNVPISRRMLSTIAAYSFVAFTATTARAEVLEKTAKVAGTTVHYKVVLPNGYDSTKAYPAILAFGGGPQTMNTVDGILTATSARRPRSAAISSSRPRRRTVELFFEGGARIFPEFLKMILADYKIQDGKFHIAGPSNGGIAAFHVAAANPQYFLSVTAFPGYMWEPSTAKLQAISKMCVFMYVGETRRVHVARRDEAGSRVPSFEEAPSRATPSRKASRTGWRRSPAPTPDGCSTDSKRPRRAAASRQRKRGTPALLEWPNR